MGIVVATSTVDFQMDWLEVLEKVQRYIESFKWHANITISQADPQETLNLRVGWRISYDQLLVPMGVAGFLLDDRVLLGDWVDGLVV